MPTRNVHLRIDFSETTFIDTHGATALLDAAVSARSRGDRLEITGWSPAAEYLRDALLRHAQ